MMNLGTGALVLLGFLLMVLGVVSKLMGISLLEPYLTTYLGYFTLGNTCVLVALIIERYQKS